MIAPGTPAHNFRQHILRAAGIKRIEARQNEANTAVYSTTLSAQAQRHHSDSSLHFFMHTKTERASVDSCLYNANSWWFFSQSRNVAGEQVEHLSSQTNQHRAVAGSHIEYGGILGSLGSTSHTRRKAALSKRNARTHTATSRQRRNAMAKIQTN